MLSKAETRYKNYIMSLVSRNKVAYKIKSSVWNIRYGFIIAIMYIAGGIFITLFPEKIYAVYIGVGIALIGFSWFIVAIWDYDIYEELQKEAKK